MKERTLFNIDEKKRNVKYVRSNSKSGELTVHVNADTTALIKEYCQMHSMNCKQFVNDVLTEKMAELEAKQDKHNSIIERTFKLEQQVDDLEKRINRTEVM